MPEHRLAVLSLHTSPLAQPGAGDGGGMNVYVDALARSLARAGVACDVLTRRDAPGLRSVVDVEPGYRVVHLDAGPPTPVPKHALVDLVDELAAAALAHIDWHDIDYDALHAHYWLSGAVGHRLKHELERPLVVTFHTLARVKAEAGVDDDPHLRAQTEHEIVGCSDLMVVSTDDERDQLERLYAAGADRVEVVPPGVDHELFSPGGPRERAAARATLGLTGPRVLLFVGRIQPLKGADLALGCLAELRDPSVELVIVGGPSGAVGAAELATLHADAARAGIAVRVHFVDPQPHDRLTAFYRAADVCLVPSRSESFGLVALEAAACGTPVIAADVGGLRSLVDDGQTGFLVSGRDPADYARPVARLLADPDRAREMGAGAQARSRCYAWSITAARLRRLYGDVIGRVPVSCR